MGLSFTSRLLPAVTYKRIILAPFALQHLYKQPPPPPGEIVNILGDDNSAKQSAQDGSSATSFNKGHSSNSGGNNTDLVTATGIAFVD